MDAQKDKQPDLHMHTKIHIQTDTDEQGQAYGHRRTFIKTDKRTEADRDRH